MMRPQQCVNAVFLPALFLLACAVPLGGHAQTTPAQAPSNTPPKGAASAPAALLLKSTIPLPGVAGRIDHFGVDVKGRRIFSCANGNHSVEVIDAQAMKRVRTIPNLGEPQGCLYDAASNRLFVASGSSEGDTYLTGEGAVRIFDGGTFALLQTVTFSTDADDVRYDTRGMHVVVAYGGEKYLRGQVLRPGGDGAIAFLDDMGKKTSEIAMDAHPEAYELEKRGTRVFVNVPDKQEVEVADVEKGKMLARWKVTACTNNIPMALDEAHHRLFVGCQVPARLAVFDTETGKTVTSAPMVETSDDMFFDPAKGRIYIFGEGFIEVWHENDPDHYERIARVATPGGAHTGLFVPEWGQVFKGVPESGKQDAGILVYQVQ